MTTPVYLLHALWGELPAVEAHQQLLMANAVAIPHLKEGDRRDRVWGWQSQSAPVAIIPGVPRQLPDSPRDPEAAAAYFESIGVRVVRKGGAA